jgi:putative PIN family toxin of toxin-antitoxin system
VTLVLSAPILAEYRAAGAHLEERYGGLEFEKFVALLVLNSELIEAPASLRERVCADPDDDKFLACALAAGARVVVSGDTALLKVSGWNGIEVIKPRALLDRLSR